jgi:hypothetical protein
MNTEISDPARSDGDVSFPFLALRILGIIFAPQLKGTLTWSSSQKSHFAHQQPSQ